VEKTKFKDERTHRKSFAIPGKRMAQARTDGENKQQDPTADLPEGKQIGKSHLLFSHRCQL